MNLKKQLLLALSIGIVALFCFCFLAYLISDQKIVQFDSTIISFVQGFESPTLTAIMKLFTFIGSGIPLVVITILILVFLYKVLKHRTELILFIGVMIGANILFSLLKLYFNRARPDLHRLIEVSGYSFPSGHSANAFAMYGILAFLLWRHIPTRFGRGILILISLVMILAIGISRIYLGVHYPSDVLGGYLLSSMWLIIAIWFYQRYKEKRFNLKKHQKAF